MKAMTYQKYGPPDVLHIDEAEKPVPGDSDVLIKIMATTVTAVDCTFRKGNSLFARFATGLRKPKNRIPGTELAGKIQSVGRDVTIFKKGDPVFGDSGSLYSTYAEYICLHENEPLTIKPENLTYEEAAAVPYGALTALPFLRDRAKVKKGQKVLVNGASGAVGTFAVQLARYFGAEVTGVCSTAKLRLVKSLGADRVIDYTKSDFTKNGETYDVIFDTVGKSSFLRCRDSLKPEGIYLTTVIGLPILFQMIWTSVFGIKKAILALTGLRSSAAKTKDLLFIKGLIEAGKIRPVTDRRYPLEQAAEAHTYVEKGHKTGSVVITVGQNGRSG